MNHLLITTLSDAGLITGKVEANQPIDSPWFVKALLAFTGWLAAGFILGFLGTLFAFTFLSKNAVIALVLGSALISAAYFLLHNKRNPFLDNLGLATSLVGQALIMFALYILLREPFAAVYFGLSFAVLQLLLIVIMPSYIHRVFSTFAATISLFFTLYSTIDSMHFYSVATLFSALLMFLLAFIWVNEFTLSRNIEKTQSIGYGLLLAQICLHAFKSLNPVLMGRYPYLADVSDCWFKPWMAEALFSVSMLYVVLKLLSKIHPKPSMLVTLLALGSVVFLSLLSIEVASLSIAIIIMLLGFSANNRLLMGLGILSLLFFISNYYYSLHNTLIDKSITLIIIGSVLLAARFMLTKLFPSTEKVAS